MLSKTGNEMSGSRRKTIVRSDSLIDSDSIWLITLSDVMSLLLIFFMMYFLATHHTAEEKKSQKHVSASMALPTDSLRSDVINATEGDIKKELDSLIEDLDMVNEVSVQAVERGIIITMKEKITFMPGEAEILKSSEELLDNIARILQQHASYMIEIDGHTDNIPINSRFYPSNWELSVARATSVLKYLINKKEIDPSRFFIKGNADQRPIVPNDTPEHRAQNRRVEIRLKETGSLL
ncbi:MAG: OmpA family protein [Nitrospirota bacterium]